MQFRFRYYRTPVYNATGATAPLAGTRREIRGEPNAWVVRHLGGNFYLVENGYAG